MLCVELQHHGVQNLETVTTVDSENGDWTKQSLEKEATASKYVWWLHYS